MAGPGEGRARTRPRSGGRQIPLIVKIVGRTAVGLALLGVAAFLAIIVLMVVGGAGDGRDISGTAIGGVLLGVLLPVMGAALILSVLLALLNQIGVRPWFDPESGHFRRPTSSADWALKLGGLFAGVLLPLTGAALAADIVLLGAAGVDPDAWAAPLISTLIGGIALAVAVAGVAGGIAVMGWFGVVAGLLLGAGLVGVVAGPLIGVPAATVLGVIATGLSVACYYAGGRLRGEIPDRIGSYAASGLFLALGAAFFVVSALSGELVLLVGGVAAVAATVGYLVGGLIGRRRRATTA